MWTIIGLGVVLATLVASALAFAACMLASQVDQDLEKRELVVGAGRFVRGT